jgi:hypothetical protein
VAKTDGSAAHASPKQFAVTPSGLQHGGYTRIRPAECRAKWALYEANKGQSSRLTRSVWPKSYGSSESLTGLDRNSGT